MRLKQSPRYGYNNWKQCHLHHFSVTDHMDMLNHMKLPVSKDVISRTAPGRRVNTPLRQRRRGAAGGGRGAGGSRCGDQPRQGVCICAVHVQGRGPDGARPQRWALLSSSLSKSSYHHYHNYLNLKISASAQAESRSKSDGAAWVCCFWTISRLVIHLKNICCSS